MLDFRKVEEVVAAVGEREVAPTVEEDQQVGKEKADTWGPEKECLHLLCFPECLDRAVQEDNIGNCNEGKISKYELGNREEARVSGDQWQGEEGEEEAKDRDQDIGEDVVGFVKVIKHV